MSLTLQSKSILLKLSLIFYLNGISSQWTGTHLTSSEPLGNHFWPYSFDSLHKSLSSNCDCNSIGGTCNSTHDICLCHKGFHGDFCDYIECHQDSHQYHQCQGKCLTHVNKTNDFKCLCDADHDGALCEISICKDYCYNNGVCSVHEETFLLPNQEKIHFVNMTCDCGRERRFSGERCEYDKCYFQVEQGSCATNCTLDDECRCVCGQNCSQFLCHNRGECHHRDGQGQACECQLGFTGQHCEHDICAACQKQGGTCIPTNSTIDCQQPIQTQNNSHSKVEELYSEFIAEASQSLQVEANILRMIIYVLSVMLFICLLLIVVIFLARRLNCNYKRSAGSKLHQLTLKFTNNQDEDRQFVINDNPEFLDQEEEERILSDV